MAVLAPAFFKFEKFQSQLLLSAKKLAKLCERTNYLNTGLRCRWAVEDASEHDSAVLCESVGTSTAADSGAV